MLRYDGYRELASAIVFRAIEDYRYAVLQDKTAEMEFEKGIISDDVYLTKSRAAKRTIREVQRFFKSSWCDYLSDLNCRDITEKLKKETLEFMLLSEEAAASMDKGIDKADNVFRCPFCGGRVDMRYRYLPNKHKHGWLVACRTCNFKNKIPVD